MGKFWGDYIQVEWGKVACWSTKAAISLKRVKIEEKLRLVHTGDYIVAEKSAKTATIILDNTSATKYFKSGRYIHRVHENKSPLQI